MSEVSASQWQLGLLIAPDDRTFAKVISIVASNAYVACAERENLQADGLCVPHGHDLPVDQSRKGSPVELG